MGLKRTLLITAACAVLAGGAGAQQNYYKGHDWQPLFNGKDLTGWKVIGEGKWAVQEGAVVGESHGKRGGFLVTERTFKEFEVSLQFFTDTDGNSGLFYHTTFGDDGKFQGGMQVEIDRTINRHTGGLHEPYGRSWVVWPAPEKEPLVKPDEWNEMLVKVVANRVITRLNGVEMVDFTDPKPKNSDGVIGVQIHSGHPMKIRFKSIYIRDLTAR